MSTASGARRSPTEDAPASTARTAYAPLWNSRAVVLLLSICAVSLAACGPLAGRGWLPGREAPPIKAVLVNGGGRPASNFQSHLIHVRELTSFLLDAGIPRRDITIFSADGPDAAADLAVREVQPEADFWLIKGTRLGRPLRTQITYENSAVDGFTLLPATRASLRSWFEEAAVRFQPGEILLFYVTDHGTKNAEDTSDNWITLWGKEERLSVTELRDLLALLDPGVRVVTLMSQCFSGAFANLMHPVGPDGVPRGNVCGFFSSTADRPAYGCYPENRDKDNVGHSFRFIDALRAGLRFPDAQARVLVTDRTPDVPLQTSDVYLERMLKTAAADRGQEIAELVDELLLAAWQEKKRWEPEIRLLDRIGRAFGLFSPRSMAELQEQAKFLPEVSSQFKSYGTVWKTALDALAAENLHRFITGEPDWKDRLDDGAVSSLDAPARRSLTRALLTDLGEYTQVDERTAGRLHFLRGKADQAAAARYRMEARLGVVLRMQSVLTSIAGRVYLASQATTAQRDAYRALTRCEDLAFGGRGAAASTPVVPEPFPSYEEELKLAEETLPGWMGIRFKQANPRLRTEFGLADGATAVIAVYPNSPAKAAGFQVGDIVVGPPNDPFTERFQIREWVMTSRIGQPAPLEVLRGHKQMRVALVPERYPLRWPSLGTTPKVGSKAPEIGKLTPYRGRLPVALARGGPVLLFFWATWCAPCKASLPEVLAFEEARGIPVVAITDELPEQLDAFFAEYDGPFPAIVASDEYRRSFLAYGVSGTPAFVLTDSSGRVQSYTVGYRRDRGLQLAGWSWSARN